MKRYLVIFPGMLLFLVVACAPVTPAASILTPTQPSAPATAYHPLDTRTGIAQVDRVLDAVASGDQQALRSLVQFIERPCTHMEGFGGPPKCREGEAEGTPVRTLALIGSEGGHIRQDEIAQWISVEADGIYAIYEVSSEVTVDENFPAGQYVLVFLKDADENDVILRLGETGIVRVDTLFDTSPESLAALLQREAGAIILAPVGQ